MAGCINTHTYTHGPPDINREDTKAGHAGKEKRRGLLGGLELKEGFGLRISGRRSGADDARMAGDGGDRGGGGGGEGGRVEGEMAEMADELGVERRLLEALVTLAPLPLILMLLLLLLVVVEGPDELVMGQPLVGELVEVVEALEKLLADRVRLELAHQLHAQAADLFRGVEEPEAER